MSDPIAARSQAPGSASPDAEQYLTFQLAEQEYGIDILRVQEIKGWDKPTRIPHSPAHVLGVINLRGAVVPVIDLHARFGRPAATLGKKTCIVIFDSLRGGERVELGLLVDAVSEVVDIPGTDIEPPPNFGGSVRRDFIRGMGKLGPRFVVILDPDKAFDVDEMAGLCEASQAALAS